MKLGIEANQLVDIEQASFEAVERKGLGHPDTLCDAIAEEASQRYSAAVYEATGRLPHHYFDKVTLMGGSSSMGFGHGEIIEPYQIQFAGKVTRQVGEGDIKFPVPEILQEAAGTVLQRTLYEFDPDSSAVITDALNDFQQSSSNDRPRYQPRQVEDMPTMNQPGRVSNDVNLCTGFYPLSRTERAVLATEAHLNSADYKVAHPYTGMDIKVAGVRMGENIRLTVNMPFISKLVGSMAIYEEITHDLRSELVEFYEEGDFPGIELEFNPQDVSGLPYFTVAGSAADTGDIGAVGRGNRPNGLITPMRPMSIEAVCGKSPVDSTGKTYGIAAKRLSQAIFEETGLPNHATIVTFRFRPIEDPANVLISVADKNSTKLHAELEPFVENYLAEIPDLTRELVEDGIVSW